VVPIPEKLTANCQTAPQHCIWLADLPRKIEVAKSRWKLILHDPFPEATAGWIAPVTLDDGSSAVIKIGLPHMEAEQEADGLKFWDGNGAVRLFDRDDDLGTILIERCEPGVVLRYLPEPEQDVVLAGLLKRLWRTPPNGHPFRPLSEMIDYWIHEAQDKPTESSESGLMNEGISLFKFLLETSTDSVLLCTDLHAGNVVSANREPWLMIDPKPFVGDPAYDATQHLYNCSTRMMNDPVGIITRFADLLEVDKERVKLWMFARATVTIRGELWQGIARKIRI
jgi:streptomycin 6-kinase